MIRFERGSLVRQAGDSGLVEEASGREVEVVVAHPSPTIGARVVIASTTTRVGVDHLTLRALLGVAIGEHDPAGPEGLRNTPVVLCTEDDVDLVLAGARRAGATAAVLWSNEPDPGLGLLRRAGTDAEVIVWEAPGGAAFDLVRTLSGIPLPVLPLPDLDRLRDRFLGARVDAHVPVPIVEGPSRRTVWGSIHALSLEQRHHLVEVDPRPAFARLGGDAATASLDRLAAGAAGVLAGRLAAGNRRWRETTER